MGLPSSPPMKLKKIGTHWVRQNEKPFKTNWFYGLDCELYLWQRPDGSIAGFELCLALDGEEYFVEYRSPGKLHAGKLQKTTVNSASHISYDSDLDNPGMYERFLDFFVKRAMDIPRDFFLFVEERLCWGISGWAFSANS